jgi:hypothetical protein
MLRNLPLISILLAILLTTSCSGSLSDIPDTVNIVQSIVSESILPTSNHFLWSYQLVYIDPAVKTTEILPVRLAATHWNILQWLEQKPCANCLKIKNIHPSGNGTILCDIEIKHPFPSPSLTGFDVRGIAMFTGSHSYPVAGMTISDKTLGDGELVNADGYSSLYNISTMGSGPGGLQGYMKGKLSTATPPNALLNGYKRFVSNKPANTRNAFYAGDTVSVTYEIDMPSGPFVFGYAVDGCWAPPITKPVKNPMTDFGPEANCEEPWKIVISGGDLGTSAQSELTIDVYDWSGKDSYPVPAIEIPEVVNGAFTAVWSEDGVGYSRYIATIYNEFNPGPGEYRCLVSINANENDPIGKPWLDLTAYQLHTISAEWVVENYPPIAIAQADPLSVAVNEPVHFTDNGSYDPDGGSIVKYEWDWDNNGVFDEEGSDTDHSWSSEGTYDVQFRVTDDEGETDSLDLPIEITVHPVSDPIALGIAKPITRSVGLPIDFSDDGSYDPDGGVIQKYEWDWENDGTFDTIGSKVTHSWSSPGLYQVQFRVTDDEGATDILDEPIQITILKKPDLVEVTPPWLNFSSNDVRLNGNYAYIAAGVNGLQIFDVSDPNNPTWLKQVKLGYDADDITFGNGYAYVTDYQGFLFIVDISEPSLSHVVGSVHIWDNHFFTCAIDGNYAYVASYYGLAVVDISLPNDPTVAGVLDFAGRVKDVASDGTYFYVLFYAETGDTLLQILDITSPTTYEVVKSIETKSQGETLNSVVLSNGYAYVTTGDIPDGRLQIFDVLPVEDAALVKTLEVDDGLNSVSVADGYAYATADGEGLFIFDVDPPETASLAKFVDTGGAKGVDVVGDKAYVGDAFGFQIMDIDPISSTHVLSGIDTAWMARDVEILNGYAYVADNGGGLQIIDINTPESASVVGVMLTPNFAVGVTQGGGYIYVGDKKVEIVNIDNPEMPQIVKSISTSMGAFYLQYDNGYLFSPDHWQSLDIIDVDPISSAGVIASVPVVGGHPDFVDINDGYAYVMASIYTGTLNVVDVDPPESAINVGNLPMDSSGISACGDFAYVGVGKNLLVIDISTPESPEIINTIPTVNGGWPLVYGNFLFIAGTRLIVFDICNPSAPVEVAKSEILVSAPFGLTAAGSYIYIAAWTGGLRIFRLD